MGRRQRTTVLIADDHPILRSGLRALLDAHADVRVVAEATTGQSAERCVDDHAPDVAIVDLGMPGGGVDLVLSLRARAPKTRVIVLTMHDDAQIASEAFAAGAIGYVVKSAECSEVLHALRAAITGERYVDPVLATQLVSRVSPRQNAEHLLSDREKQVLTLVARGYTNREIAKTLAVGTKTVETYRARAMVKASLTSRSEIVSFVVAAKWIDATE